MHTHICTHTHLHTHTFAHTHICTHRFAHTDLHTHICTHTHTHTHALSKTKCVFIFLRKRREWSFYGYECVTEKKLLIECVCVCVHMGM
jgi:hypothetical protein